VASDGEFWVSRVFASIEQLEKDTKHVALLVDADFNDQSLHNRAKEVSVRLKKVSSDVIITAHV
jgi:DNA polymerase phi